MTTFEVIISLMASGIFSALLALFYRFGKNQERTDNSFKAIENNFKAIEITIKELKGEIRDLSDEIEDVDRRLCRIEASLATQGHCLFNQSKPEQKAQ